MATTRRYKTRDADFCSINFLKYALQIFNIFIFFAGIGVLGVGIWTVVLKYHHLALLSTSTYAVIAYTFIVAGCLGIISAILGCTAVWQENRCFMLVYTFLLLLIFLMEAMVGILAYVYTEQVENELTLNLNETFVQSYSIDETRTAAIDQIQTEYRCCGAIRFEDWQHSAWWRKQTPPHQNKVPDSCCKTFSPDCGKRDHPSNISYDGCVHKFSKDLESHLIVLGAVGLGICVLHIFGMVFTCWLYVKLKDVVD